MEHYFDNAATTRPLPEVAELMREYFTDTYGNPSSLHRKGIEAEKRIKSARGQIAEILKVEPGSLYFTSCATESITTAIQGTCRRLSRFGRHILTSRLEHAAVRENLNALQMEGFEIEYLDNDQSGVILREDLEKKLRPDTILVSLIHVNNETGAITPLEGLGKLIHARAPHAFFHLDATQSFGKYPIYPRPMEIDLLSASAHKLHGPKGIGLLYKARSVNIPPLIIGGGQESGFRSGTENTAYIAAFGYAAENFYAQREEILSRMKELKIKLCNALTEAIPEIRPNGPSLEEGAPYILNLLIPDVRAEVLLHSLEDQEIYIGSGSACSSHRSGHKDSPLAALGLNQKEIESSIRISLSRFTTEEDIDAITQAMKEKIPMLRRFVRK